MLESVSSRHSRKPATNPAGSRPTPRRETVKSACSRARPTWPTVFRTSRSARESGWSAGRTGSLYRMTTRGPAMAKNFFGGRRSEPLEGRVQDGLNQPGIAPADQVGHDDQVA